MGITHPDPVDAELATLRQGGTKQRRRTGLLTIDYGHIDIDLTIEDVMSDLEAGRLTAGRSRAI